VVESPVTSRKINNLEDIHCVRDAGTVHATNSLRISSSINGKPSVANPLDTRFLRNPTAEITLRRYYSRTALISLTAVVGLRFWDKPCLDGPLQRGYGAREVLVLVN
jgi:hypothetical protein